MHSHKPLKELILFKKLYFLYFGVEKFMKYDQSLFLACMNTIKQRSFSNAYKKTFSLQKALREEEKLKSYRLRYRVYCEENDLEESSIAGPHMEQDIYDENSIHYVLMRRKKRETVGTLRVVLPNTAKIKSSFPMQDYCDHPLIHDPLRTLSLCEISRFCMAPEYRKRPEDGRFLSGFYEQDEENSIFPFYKREIVYAPAALLQGAFETALQHRIMDCLWMVEINHLWSLSQLGFPYRALGPHIEYCEGLQPIIFNIKSVLDSMHTNSPHCWEIVSDFGRLHQKASALHQEAWHDNLIDGQCLDAIFEKLSV